MHQTTPLKNVVLYADDDVEDLMLVREALSSYAPHVKLITKLDGQEVLDYLNGQPPQEPTPCLIILDINMPRLNGRETLVRIRQLTRFENVPVVLFSTSSMPHERAFATRYGAGYITKPLDYHQMEVIAGHFIDHCTDEIKKKLGKEV